MMLLQRSFAALLGLIVLSAAEPVHAQVEVGADLMSRYVWRGTDFGESPSIQPALSYTRGGFEIGAWAAYPISSQSFEVNEHNFWLGYTAETAAGEISVGVTDYHFPSGAQMFNFSNGGEGAHFIEPYIAYTGPASFPISVFAGAYVYNDPDKSTFFSLSYPVAVSGAEVSFLLGGTPAASELYGTTGAAILETGISATKSLPITESFSLPLTASYLLNPYAERGFFIFGISF